VRKILPIIPMPQILPIIQWGTASCELRASSFGGAGQGKKKGSALRGPSLLGDAGLIENVVSGDYTKYYEKMYSGK